MLEMEESFIGINENIERIENLIKYIINSYFTKSREDLEYFTKWIDKELINNLQNIINLKFEVVTYTECIDILLKSNKKFIFPVFYFITLRYFGGVI
jgi:asparaginyl-tRNA synthetase